MNDRRCAEAETRPSSSGLRPLAGRSAGATVAWILLVFVLAPRASLATPACTTRYELSYLDIGMRQTDAIAADFDRDGKPDLVLVAFDANESPHLLFFRGKGDGTFEDPKPAAPPLDGVNGLAITADLNHDDRLDLVICFYQGNEAWELFGNGDGTFTVFGAIKTPWPYAVAAADFDHDGNQDLAFSSPSAPLETHLGLGNGAFRSPVEVPERYYASSRLAAGDIDGDGTTDLVMGQYSQVEFTNLARGNGDGTFRPEQVYTYFQLFALALVDVDDDGDLDIVSASSLGRLVVLINDRGRFAVQTSYLVDAIPNGLFAYGFDSKAGGRVAVPTIYPNTLTILAASGEGKFAIEQALRISPPDRSDVPGIDMAFADFDGDGDTDFVMTTRSHYLVLGRDICPVTKIPSRRRSVPFH